MKDQVFSTKYTLTEDTYPHDLEYQKKADR